MSPSVFWIHDIEPLRLALMPKPRGGSMLWEDVKHWGAEGITVVVSLLCTDEREELCLLEEQSVCRSCGIRYFSFPIVDRGVPDSAPGFFALADDLASRMRQGAAVAVHCRAGIGRSALAAGAILLRLGVSVEDIFPRLSRARGFTIPDTASQIDWFNSIAEQYGVRSSGSLKSMPHRGTA